jgi:hypothetical protein
VLTAKRDAAFRFPESIVRTLTAKRSLPKPGCFPESTVIRSEPGGAVASAEARMVSGKHHP